MNNEEIVWDVTQEGFCIWDWNLQTGTMGMCSNYLKVLGLTREEYEPSVSWFNQLVHPEDLPVILMKLESNMDDFKEVDRFEFRLMNKDCTYQKFESKGMVVLHTTDGKPEQIIWASKLKKADPV